MGSPVSAVIAELVMQEVEEKALETSPVEPKWWAAMSTIRMRALRGTVLKLFTAT